MSAGFDVACLPLPPDTRQKLIASGFINTRDFRGIGTVELASELQITHEDALAILRAAGYSSLGKTALQGATTAVEILAREKANRKILTFCGDLDKILGGGIATGQITELCGAPAVGKTQLGYVFHSVQETRMQLAIDVQIPAAYGGLEAEALYIDTEGSFFVDRAIEMAKAYVKHIKRLAAHSKNAANIAAAETLTWESALDKIHLLRALDLSEQLAAMHNLEGFVETHPKVKLVVVDSMAFHLRQGVQNMAHRTRLLAQLSQKMMQVASKHSLAIVLTNHVTTKITAQQARIVPALGESWAHASTNRIILFWKEQQRVAFLYKSPSLPARSAEYLITKEGVRGKRPSQKRARQ